MPTSMRSTSAASALLLALTLLAGCDRPPAETAKAPTPTAGSEAGEEANAAAGPAEVPAYLRPEEDRRSPAERFGIDPMEIIEHEVDGATVRAPAGVTVRRYVPPVSARAGVPAPTSENPPVPGAGPRILFERGHVDLGGFRENETRSATLWFENVGDAELQIIDVSSTCGCTVAEPDRERFAPGERGTLSIEFDPSAPGDQTKTVRVLTNALDDPYEVTVRANIEALVEIEPRLVSFGRRRLGVEHLETVRVRFPNDTYRVLEVTTTNPAVQATIVSEAATPTEAVIDVVVAPDAPWGMLFSWLRIVVEGRPTLEERPVRYDPRIRVQGQLFGDLEAEPDTFRYGALPGEAVERAVMLRRADGRPLTVHDARLTEGNLEPGAKVVVQGAADGSKVLILRIPAAGAPGPRRALVRVRTDVVGEETVTIEVVGVVREPAPGG